MCAALGSCGGFCAGSFDATAGRPDEARLCSTGRHRFAWDGQRWNLELDYVPDPAVATGDADREPVAP